MPNKDIFVLPLRGKLDGKGCVWEYLIYSKGWNDLPDEEKPGEIIDFFELDNGEVVVDICWPALDLTTKNVFLDEIKLVNNA